MNRKAIVSAIVITGLIGCVEISGRSNPQAFEQYMKWKKENAPTAMEADSNSNKKVLINKNYNIDISRGAIDRQALTDEQKVIRINKILDGRLKNKGDVIMDASKLYHVDVFRLTAIICQETGFGTDTRSSLYSHNNVGGVFKGPRLKHFRSVDESIYEVARILADYKDRGIETLTDIKKIYCPDGASNDPTGLNKHWLPNTLKIYNQLLEDI